MRLSGLASGFDTESMVQDLMKVERMKVDRFTQNRQLNLWRKESYNDINKSMANFVLNSQKNMGLKHTSSTGITTDRNFRNLDYVKTASSYNESVADVDVIGSAANGRFNVKVDKLATDARFTTGKGYKRDTKLTEDVFINGVISINGVKVGKIGDSVKDLLDNISGSDELKKMDVTAFLDDNTGRIFIQGRYGKETDGGYELNIEGLGSTTDRTYTVENAFEEEELTKKLTIDGKVFDVGTTFEDIKKGLKDKNITLEKDKNGSIIIKTSNNNIDVKSGQDEIIAKEPIIQKGSYGSAEINGVKFDKLTSNELKFNGLNISMKVEGETTIDVSTNTAGIMDKIKGLVDDYNELIDEMSGAVGEERFPSFHPLSQDEKSAMTDKDIELWEEKARSGMLNRDETLNRIMQNVRNDLFKNVKGLDGTFTNITQIGITTEKYSRASAGGRLEIDEDKLRKAIENDAEGVMELLFAGETDGEIDKSSAIGETNKGVFTGVYDSMRDGMKSIIEKSGPGEDSNLYRSIRSNMLIDYVTKGSISDIDKDVQDIDRRIANLEAMLAKKEESYYSQFTRMEKYMYKMNNQADWLGQQMMMM